MSVFVKVIPHANLVYVKHAAVASSAAALKAFTRYMEAEDFAPLQHHLVDLTDVQEFEKDYPSIMQLTARLIDSAPPARVPPIMGVLAPTPAGQEYAQLSIRALGKSNRLTIFVDEDERRLMETMGLRARSIEQLLNPHESSR